jgi:hypothetical protein
VLRLGVETAWSQANERYRAAGGGRESLGRALTRDSLGPDVIESVRAIEDPLRTLSGLAAPPLSLGAVGVALETTAYVTPITLEYGLTDRFALGAVVPYIKNRVEVFAAPNPGGLTGTLGVNPALSLEVARTRNGQVVTELQAAATMLQNELARCLNSADPSCAAINADRQAAGALVSTANVTASAVASVFGTATAAGAPFAPLDRSALHLAIDTRLASLNTQFRGFLGGSPTGDWIAARPVPAAPLGLTEFQRVLSDTAFGIAARTLTDVEHSHLGDVEVGGKLLLVDTYGHRLGRDVPPGPGARLAVAGVVRLPTAQRDSPDDFADIGTGDRTLDVEVRGMLDLFAGPALWASAVVRYALQRPDRLTARVVDRPGDPFPALFRRFEVERDLGDVLEVEVAPRLAPNDALAFSAAYRLRVKGADRYRGRFEAVGLDAVPITLDAATLGRDTGQREHRLGLAVTYSTVRAYGERQARWPLDVALIHSRVLGGQGVPDERATAIGIRVYRRLAGPNPMRPPAR